MCRKKQGVREEKCAVMGDNRKHGLGWVVGDSRGSTG